MSAPNNIERAFPRPEYGEHGMTLRDWFAGQALSGCLEREDKRAYPEMAEVSIGEWLDARRATDARRCYQYADAMLAEKNRRNP